MRFLLILGALIAIAESNHAVADDLLTAPKEAPRYQLSNIRVENDNFARQAIVVDYKLVSKGTAGTGGVQVSGKTKSGPLKVYGFGAINDSGQLRIRVSGFATSISDVEIYMIRSGTLGKNYMVSNAVRLGNPGSPTRPRPWTAEEKQAAERAKLYAVPPAEIPAGFLPVTDSTNLVPGMMIKAGHYGEWQAAEVIRCGASGPVTLKYSGVKHLVVHPREKWLAVDPQTLELASSDPNRFKPSVQALPGSRMVIPEDAIPLATDLELPEGTPLLYDHGFRWRDVYVVWAEASKVRLRYEGLSDAFDITSPRSKLLITNTTLKELSEPGASEKFAKHLDEHSIRGRASRSSFPSKGGRGTTTIKHKDYKVTIGLPPDAQFVPDDLTIEHGTALAACWASRWNPITAIHENEDGSLHVHWDDYSDAFDCNMTRDQLIIENKTVRMLRSKQSQGSDELKKTLRTWTDRSGQHKVEARFVQRTETNVTLMTDAGREITLSIEQLSDQDQDVLSGVIVTAVNPFE